jgi:hypothetical protein
MKMGRINLLAGLLMVTGGCSGRLTFDPRSVEDAGQGLATNDAGPAVGGAPAAPAPDAGDPSYGEPRTVPDAGSHPTADSSPPPSPLDAASGNSDGPSLLTDAGAARDSGPPAGADGPPPASGSSCPDGLDVLTSVFKTRCGACHGASGPAQNLDLVSMGLGARMVGKASTCMDRPLIDRALSGDEPTGFLFDKLLGPVAGCGVQMPAGASPLSPVEMACLKEWAVNQVNGR